MYSATLSMYRPATTPMLGRTIMPANQGSVSANGSSSKHMDSRQNRRTPRILQQRSMLQSNGLYQHISLPRAIPALKPAAVQQWLREGDVERLKQLVTDGQGHRLLGEKPNQHSTRLFLRTLPGLMARQEELHSAAEAGKTEQVTKMLEDPSDGARLVVSKDTAGLGLLHKAVLGGHMELASMLMERYPQTLTLRDNEGRTALHYCGASPDPSAMWSLLESSGVDAEVVDRRGHRARQYMPKSSNLTSTRLGITHAAMQATVGNPTVVTRANIRKWIHERDLAQLENLLWSGHGERLLPETSASPKVRRFLEAVPFIMGKIKEVHFAAVSNNVSLWRMRTSNPVPPHMLLSQDKNGLTPLHKAAGLGHVDIVSDILSKSPEAAKVRDSDKRSPLHYAAATRQGSSSDIYRMLVEAGADQTQIDKKGHSPSYYAEHPGELDSQALLSVTPEAPRAPTALPPSWNWNMLVLGVDAVLSKTMTVLPAINNNKPRPAKSHPNLTSIESSTSKQPISNSTSHPELSQPKPKPRQQLPNKINKPKRTISSPDLVNESQGKSNDDRFTKSQQKLNDSQTKTLPNLPLKQTDTKLISKQNDPVTKSQPNIPAKLNDTQNKLNNTLPASNKIVPPKPPPTKATDMNKSQKGPMGVILSQHSVSTPPTTFSFSPGAMYQPNPPQTAPTRSDVMHITSVPPGTAPASHQLLQYTKEHPEPAPVRPISPPGSRMPAPVMERWVRAGDLGRLEDALLEGRGPRLLKLIANAAKEPQIRAFLERAPMFMAGMQKMHEVTAAGDEKTVRLLIGRYRRLVLSRDEEGMQPMHVAARAGDENILRVLLAVFPRGVSIVDWEGRTPLHYAGMCSDFDRALTCYQLLLAHGAPEEAKDAIGNRAADYLSETRIQQTITPQQRMDTPAIGPNSSSASRPSTKPDPPRTAPRNENKPETSGSKSKIPQTPGPKPLVPQIPTVNIPENDLNDPQISNNPVLKEEDLEQNPEANSLNATPEVNYGTIPPSAESEFKVTSDNSLPKTGESEYYQDPEMPDPEMPDPEMYDNEIFEPEISETAQKRLPTAPVSDFPETPAAAQFPGKVPQSPPLKPYQSPEPREPFDPVKEEAKRLVRLKDTEKLAELVLAGHGEKLKGLTSDNPYVQGLLDNVPVYMDKIAAVHESAARGDIAALQVALERRKFVTSRDKYGATPLHKAVLFLQVGVARYLGTRFPESLNAQDNAGRTSLHYAAVLPDRGALYRSLVALGADPRIRDKRGHTAMDYQLHHEQRRNHEQLLQELGADPTLAGHALDPARAAAAAAAAAVSLDMLQMPEPETAKSDASRGIRSSPWRNEDGHFVATSVGEPLLKGLMEVSSVRPKDPISFLANFLYNFPRTKKRDPASVPNRVQTGYRDENEAIVDDDERRERLQTAGSMASAAGSTNRDEHGQSMLHLAAARSHSRHAFAQILREAGLSVGQRDALYRTPRDVAMEAGIPENVRDIDAWVLHLALEGDITRLDELLLDGYDHILDVTDTSGMGIIETVQRNHVTESLNFLNSIKVFEEKRDWIHKAIRVGSLEGVREVLNSARLAVARNNRGRCSLHLAVLCQQIQIAEYIANTFPVTLGAGDNLERSPLHYSMAMEKAEELSLLLVKAGARRTLKDLKGRQASFYFVNRNEILKLRDEETRNKGVP